MEQQKPSCPKCFVIAISAISGGGKSTLAKSLLPLLGDATTLSFDDYAPVYCPTSVYPHDFRRWLEEGLTRMPGKLHSSQRMYERYVKENPWSYQRKGQCRNHSDR